MRYEIGDVDEIDFTWVREWRVCTGAVQLPLDRTTVIVPKRDWRDALVDTHFEKMKAQVAEKGSAAADIRPYPWHIIVLEDLGIPIPDGLS